MCQNCTITVLRDSESPDAASTGVVNNLGFFPEATTLQVYRQNKNQILTKTHIPHGIRKSTYGDRGTFDS